MESSAKQALTDSDVAPGVKGILGNSQASRGNQQGQLSHWVQHLNLL